MIVTDQPDNTLRVVAQPDHAAVSAELAERWCRPAAIPEAVWPRFLQAVREHDAGWHTAEQTPAVDVRGRPHNFKSVETDEHVAIWWQSIEHLRQRDAYAGLLVALHARWLYTHVASDSERELGTVQHFIAQLDQEVDRLLGELARGEQATQEAVQPEALEAARRLLGLLDALSLMLAGGLSVGGFPEPVAFESRTAVLSVQWRQAPAGMIVEPWPFACERFSVQVRARQIPDRRYRSSTDLAAAIRRADAYELERQVEPGS